MKANGVNLFNVSFDILGDPRPLALKRPRAVHIAGHTRLYDPAGNVSAKEQVKAVAVARNGLPEKPYEDAACLTFTACVPIPRSWSQKKQKQASGGAIWPTGAPDLDNIQKLIGDSLQHVFIRNDAQICVVHGTKKYAEQPMLAVCLRSL